MSEIAFLYLQVIKLQKTFIYMEIFFEIPICKKLPRVVSTRKTLKNQESARETHRDSLKSEIWPKFLKVVVQTWGGG